MILFAISPKFTRVCRAVVNPDSVNQYDKSVGEITVLFVNSSRLHTTPLSVGINQTHVRNAVWLHDTYIYTYTVIMRGTMEYVLKMPRSGFYRIAGKVKGEAKIG